MTTNFPHIFTSLIGVMDVPQELDGISKSPVDWELLQDNAVYNLFTTSDGRCMSFYLDLPEDAKCFMENYIHIYGGTVCQSSIDIDAWTVVLKNCPSFVNSGRPCFMVGYVTDCMTDRTLHDINGYKLNNSSGLCEADLMKVVYYRTGRFTGKFVLDHVYRGKTTQKSKRSEEAEGSKVQTVAIGPHLDWHHEMADAALKFHLTNVDVHYKAAVLRKIARNCGGSSLVVRVHVTPENGSSVVEQSAHPVRSRKRRLGDQRKQSPSRSNNCDDVAYSVNSLFSDSSRSSWVSCEVNNVPLQSEVNQASRDVLPIATTSHSPRILRQPTRSDCVRNGDSLATSEQQRPAIPNSIDCNDSYNFEISSVDLRHEILSEFKEFLVKKSLPRANSLLERFKIKKLPQFVEKLRNSPESSKCKNIDRNVLHSLRGRVKSVLFNDTRARIPSPHHRCQRRSKVICLSKSRGTSISCNPLATLPVMNDSGATSAVIADAPPVFTRIQGALPIFLLE